MKIPLVIGANGATGQKVLEAFIAKQHTIYALVRDARRLPHHLRSSPFVNVVEGDVLSMPEDALIALLAQCDQVISCLGHNLSFRGIYLDPHRFVSQSIKRIIGVINKRLKKHYFKLIILSSVGVKNRTILEKNDLIENLILGAIKLIIPPHADNLAVEKLLFEFSNKAGKNRHIEWVMVRPDTLVDELISSHYEVFESPQESALFGEKKTSREDIGVFINELSSDKNTWDKWAFKMPVIYSKN